MAKAPAKRAAKRVTVAPAFKNIEADPIVAPTPVVQEEKAEKTEFIPLIGSYAFRHDGFGCVVRDAQHWAEIKDTGVWGDRPFIETCPAKTE